MMAGLKQHYSYSLFQQHVNFCNVLKEPKSEAFDRIELLRRQIEITGNQCIKSNDYPVLLFDWKIERKSRSHESLFY